MALVLITITMMLLQFQMKRCVGCVESERMGLLQLKSYFKNVLDLKEESFLESWSLDHDPKSECCHWERVKCNEEAFGGHIVELSLDYLNPNAYWETHRPFNLSLLHSFTQLITLNFSSNWFDHLFDPIHGYKSFERLEKLMTLDLTENNFNNSVLPFISAAKSLKILNLKYNKLEGVFPPNELTNMTELKVLNMGINGFNFFFVQGLINLRELESLDLSFNNINDCEAGDGVAMTKLKTLNLSYNSFSDTARLKGLEYFVELKILRLRRNRFNDTRTIQVLKDLPKLEELDLSQNEFTNLDNLGLGLPLSLQVLDLSWNQLFFIPKGYSNFCKLMNLKELDLRSNALTNMPNCLGNLTRLRTLDISNNVLSENLSSFVSGLPSALEYLSLLRNNFNGSFLFNSLANQTRLKIFKLSSKVGVIQAHAESSWVPRFQLEMLKLHNFNLGGTIPGFLVHQHDLIFVDISYNQLTGAFPSWLMKNNTRIKTLLLRSNSLIELQLPRLVHGLQVFDISNNVVYDSIQEDIGIVFPHLRYMNFSFNRFQGALPTSLGKMKSLEVLDMSSNGLFGKLPKEILGSCYPLRLLKLSNNQFEGNIFPGHANLTGLLTLFLDGNNFSGSLGKGLLNSKTLTILDISYNSFSGTLPLWISRMSSLQLLDMKRNRLKGHFPRQLQNLQQLVVMDISHNSFSGSLPKSFDFPSLTELRLHNNEFVGSIPDTLFSVVELYVLDLRNNKFSGNILNSIGKSSELRVLLLGNNNLQGHIPEKKICQLSKAVIMDLSHNEFKGVIPSCFGNMSFGAYPISETFFEPAYESTIPLLEGWSYPSAFENDDDLDDRYQVTPTTVVNFLTKSRYETYQGNILVYMRGLDLSSNQLSGKIPTEIGNLHYIKSLNLSNNKLTGSIPDNISKMKSLESLDLSNNKLCGNIPPQLADLNSLGFFNVSCNNLSGEIPFKGHLVTFNEKSYTDNPYLCGIGINKSCHNTDVYGPDASKHDNEEEEEDHGLIDMAWFYWSCGGVYISTLLALFAFLSIDSRLSREWFNWVDALVHHLQRFKDCFFCN